MQMQGRKRDEKNNSNHFKSELFELDSLKVIGKHLKLSKELEDKNKQLMQIKQLIINNKYDNEKDKLYSQKLEILKIDSAVLSEQLKYHLDNAPRVEAQLYNDLDLSEPAGQGCVSCHDPGFGFADPDQHLPVSEGVIPGRFDVTADRLDRP